LLYFGDDREISLLSLVMLALGDTTASFGGRLYIRCLKPIRGYTDANLKKSGKTMAGSFSAFLAGTLIMLFYYHFDLAHLFPSIIGGAICSIGEYVDIYGLDDNLTMPITCAILLKTLRPFVIV
jgi:dolichol kinase